MINSEVVCDSLNPVGIRITTLKLTYPRIIHSEFMTHRVFSRSASSSRAVPAKRLINNVVDNPFIPIEFQKAHSGMQGTENMIGTEKEDAIALWLEARDYAVKQAKLMLDAGITKQIINRILEPYQYYQTLMTATEFDNFFELRDHEAAEIHIQALAQTMKEARDWSIPNQLEEGEWHIPYGDNISRGHLNILMSFEPKYFQESGMNWITSGQLDRAILEIATARCARLSYETLGAEPKIDYKADLELFNRLIVTKPMHASPAEHCSQAMNDSEFYKNFRGFKQFRQVLEEQSK